MDFILSDASKIQQSIDTASNGGYVGFNGLPHSGFYHWWKIILGVHFDFFTHIITYSFIVNS
jgi:hypothetical protein